MKKLRSESKVMRPGRISVFGFALTALLATPALASTYKLTDTDPDGKQSYYTPRLVKVLDQWPPATLQIKDDSPVMLRAIKTEGHPHYIGMVKHFTIDAPLDKVVDITEDFEKYPQIWDGVLECKVLSRDGNRIVTDWVRKRPTFFMPKIKYKMLYIIDKSVPDRVVYRQQLIEGNAMYFSDGLVVLEKTGPSATRVSVIDFFDANFGPFRGIMEGIIWEKSMENSFKDDIAFSARIMHPDWDVSKISKEAEEQLDKHPIKPIRYTDSLKFD